MYVHIFITPIDVSAHTWIVSGLIVFTAVSSVGLFIANPSETTVDPVSFDDTVKISGTLEDTDAVSEEATPGVQVFYDRYRHPLGYHDPALAATEYDSDRHEEQFGSPIATYVTDFTNTNLTLDDHGHPSVEVSPGWIPASDAVYVQNSKMNLPSGPVTAPFSDERQAELFIERYGGVLRTWEDLQNNNQSSHRNQEDLVDDQHQRSNKLINTTTRYLDRAKTTVVQPNESVQSAIQNTPSNSTVLLSEGRYEQQITINQSITLRGSNTTIVGNNTGSVINVTADDVAISDVHIKGAGDSFGHTDVGAEGWDSRIEAGYGHGDAGVTAINASRPLISNVSINTSANGVLLRDTADPVVRNISVVGSDHWLEGFMGVVAMRSSGIVEQSSFLNGRDGVYSHRSDGLVVRNNTMTNTRFGVHLMYSSDVLIAGNSIERHIHDGITVMTNPTGVSIVNNHVRNGGNGMSIYGNRMFVQENEVINNEIGIVMSAPGSIYEQNLLKENDIGARTSVVTPTSIVSQNDFIDNTQHADTLSGPLRIWADNVGNHWSDAPNWGTSNTSTRPFVPTDTVDQQARSDHGARTLAHAPALQMLRTIQGTTPGLRSESIVDTDPLTTPVTLAKTSTANNPSRYT